MKKVAIGVDLGASKVLSVLADFEGEVLDSSSHKINVSEGLESNLLAIRKSINDVYPKSKKFLVKGVGVGLSGTPDSKTGKVIWSSNNPNLRGFELGQYLQKFFNNHVILKNDSQVFALSEHFFLKKEKRDVQNLAALIWGSGVGAGLIINDKIIDGCQSFGGKLGHIRVSQNLDAPLCRCGKKGCLESYISGIHIFERYKDLFVKRFDSEVNVSDAEGVIKLYREGDNLASQILELGLEKFAIGIAGLLTIFVPQIVIFGGSVSQNEDLVLELEEKVRSMIYPPIKDKFSFEISPRIKESGALGAAMMVFNKISS